MEAYDPSVIEFAFHTSRTAFAALAAQLADPAADRLDHAALEDIITCQGREVLRLLLQDLLDLRAVRERERQGRDRLPAPVDAQGTAHRAVETGHTRQLATVVGRVTVRRSAHRARGAANLYPADAALNLPAGHCVQEAVRGSFDAAIAAITTVCGPVVAKRQARQLVRAAAADVAAFYTHAQTAPPSTEATLLVLSFDGKGIPMLPAALREETRKKAQDSGGGPYRTRLASGHKSARKRMAAIAAVYDAAPAARRPHDVIQLAGAERTARRKGPKAERKWLTASLARPARQVIAEAFDRAEERDPAHRRTWVVLVDDGHQIVAMLRRLRETEAADHAAALARRAAENIALEDPGKVADLMRGLRETGMTEHTALLRAREPAAHASLGSAQGLASLLDALRESNATEQITMLIARAPDARTSLDNPYGVGDLVRALREVEAVDHSAALADRAIAHTDPTNVHDVGQLTYALHKAGASGQATDLTHRAVISVAHDEPFAGIALLEELLTLRAVDHAHLLAGHIAAQVPLDAIGLIFRLRRLLEAGLLDEFTVLADHVPLDYAGALAELLRELQAAGANDQVTALADRATAQTIFTIPSEPQTLLEALRSVGAIRQARLLTDRLPAEGHFATFLQQDNHPERFRFGREPDGCPAAPWGWDDVVGTPRSATGSSAIRKPPVAHTTTAKTTVAQATSGYPRVHSPLHSAADSQLTRAGDFGH
jgi:hypothetical protein